VYGRRFVALLMAALLLATLGAQTAHAQLDTGEAYWGEHTVNAIFHLWPAATIAVLMVFVAGGLFGFYELDATTVLFLLGASAFLAYHYYWRPVHLVSLVPAAHSRAVAPRLPVPAVRLPV
jgi:hypothetical protein